MDLSFSPSNAISPARGAARSDPVMTVGELFRRSGVAAAPSHAAGGLEATVRGVAYDSRTVAAGELFVALKGAHTDGTAFVDQARARGAVGVVAEAPCPAGTDTPWAEVADARATLAVLAATFHEHPSQQLVVVGTTGTNGKTTTTYLIEGVFVQAGIPCGRVSSVSYRVADDEQSAVRTTPEAPDLQALLRRMVDGGCKACAMEVSSHALALHRVDAISFDVVVFTNLTRDHLDFHGDMVKYFGTKKQLFEMTAATSTAVVNVDDPYGRTLAGQLERLVTYGIDEKADVAPSRIDLSRRGVRLDLSTPRGPMRIESRLLGRGNAYNILAAAATGVALDLPLEVISLGVASVPGVPGRMQMVSTDEDAVSVIVDFAHTDDAMRGLLETARRIAGQRVITVFGCGGDRDATKRPLMGAVASRLSDLVIVTSDNPRSEDPERIAQDIEAGLAGGPTPWLRVLDRAEAISQAISEARRGDVVVIAGKGHEQYQTVGSRSMPFDDVAVARAALASTRPSGSRVG